MNESDIEENIFYLRRVHIVPTNFDGEVGYQSGKQVYRGITQLGCFYQGTLPVRNLLPNIEKGLTLVEAIAGGYIQKFAIIGFFSSATILPVFRFLSNLGKLLLDISILIR